MVCHSFSGSSTFNGELHGAMEAGFENKYRQKLHEKAIRSHQNGQCLLWGGFKVHGYGRINVFHNGKWQNLTVHRLAYMLHYKCTYNSIEGLDVSHLCHNAACIEGSHLTAEPHVVNNERQSCKNMRRCIKHSSYRDCLMHYILD